MDLQPHPTRPLLVDLDTGDVYRKLKSSPSSGGYRTIKTGNETVRRHTLVCETAHGERPFPGAQVRHLDDDPSNDVASNLRWGTHQDNMADAVRNGKTTRGERNASAKLSNEQALAVYRRRVHDGESLVSLAEEYGMTPASVCDLAKGRTWAWLTGASDRGLPWG